MSVSPSLRRPLVVFVVAALLATVVRRADLVEAARAGDGSAPAAAAESGGLSFGGGSAGRRVEVLAPRRGPIAETVEAPGTVRPGSETGVSAPFEGQVVELAVDEGDTVAEGDLIFRLDPTDKAEAVEEAELALARAEAAVAEREAERDEAERQAVEAAEEPSEVTEARLRLRQSELQAERARAELASAETTVSRAQLLRERGIGAEVEVQQAEDAKELAAISARIAREELSLARETLAFRERTWADTRAAVAKDLAIARSRVESAEADVRTAEVALERARRDLERTEVRTPLAGVVTGRAVNHGDLVNRLTGSESHYIVSDLSRLLVYADVDEGDVIAVSRGQRGKVWVSALGPDVELEGVVYTVAHRAQVAEGHEVATFLVRVLLDPEQARHDQLRPGMSATVEVETGRAEDALKVPLQAIVQRTISELPEELREDERLAGREDTDLIDVLYVVVDGEARVVVPELGLRDDDEVEVGGAYPHALTGESVLVVGPFRALPELEDGEAVRTTEAEGVLPDEGEPGDGDVEKG